MKQLSIILLSAALIVGLFFILKPTPTNQPATNLPWQIERHADGTSTVFGITLGTTSFDRAGEILGINREVAVIIGKDDRASLEMYYSHFRAGPLAGKLVITADASPELSARLAEQSATSEYLGTGSRRFNLELQDIDSGDQVKVQAITFIPSTQLDADIIEGRFGKPDQLVAAEKSRHYLYPELGLDIVLNEEGKETLQYVAPRDFELLRQPLQSILVQ